jgi:hypothetical protein
MALAPCKNGDYTGEKLKEGIFSILARVDGVWRPDSSFDVYLCAY